MDESLIWVLIGLMLYWATGWTGVRIIKHMILSHENWTKGRDIKYLISVIFCGTFMLLGAGVCAAIDWCDGHGDEKSTWKIF